MTIEYRQGDLLQSGAGALVNPTNTEGVSGKGLALAIKRAYPRWEFAYRAACQRGEIRVGEVWHHSSGLTKPYGIYAFPTKDRWRDPSKIEWIRDGLDSLVASTCVGSQRLKGCSLALPALGCGLGGLDWRDVRPLIHAAASRMSEREMAVYIYEPQ